MSHYIAVILLKIFIRGNAVTCFSVIIDKTEGCWFEVVMEPAHYRIVKVKEWKKVVGAMPVEEYLF